MQEQQTHTDLNSASKPQNAKTQDLAKTFIQPEPAKQSDALLLEACRQIRRHNRQVQRIRMGLFVSIGGGLLYIPLLFSDVIDRLPASAGLFVHIAVPLLIVCVPFIPLLGMLASFKEVVRSMRRLYDSQDVRSIGTLIDSLDSTMMYPAVVGLLTNLLPRLQANHADLLTPQQRALLCRVLRWNTDSNFHVAKNPRFAVAILKALEQIGDGQALPTVERLARKAADKQVREAAQACLLFLQARVEEEKGRQNLLRPSSSSTAQPAELLRAAEETTEEKPEELLRAGTERQA